MASSPAAKNYQHKRVMEFDLESKLLNVLHATSEASGVFARRNAELLVFKQVELGSTIPDLVIVRRRLRVGLGVARTVRLTAFESWVLGEIMRSGQLHEATLSRKLFAFEPDIKRALNRLERQSLLCRTSTGAYGLVADFTADFEVLSIEAKLTRWKEALDQARAYLRFSDLAFIALPASVIDRNETIEEACEREGIGLIAVTEHDLEIVVAPDLPSRPDRREWTWLLSKTGALQILR